VLRLLLFAIPLAILLVLRVPWWISVPAAALIALPLSYIFLRRPRHDVAVQLNEVRKRDKLAPMHDDIVEDAQIDAADLAAPEDDFASGGIRASDPSMSAESRRRPENA
jgi:hypothetical protein